MTISTRKSLIRRTILSVLCLWAWHAQVSGQAAGVLDATAFNQWQLPEGSSPVNGQISYNSQSACTVTSSGYTFVAAKVGRPLTIVDLDRANTETIVPTAVTVSGSACTIQAPMAHVHYTYVLQSATYGLQEALDYVGGQGPGVVSVGPAWARAGGTTAMLTAANGATGLSILDARSAVQTPYAWTGTAFVAQASGAGAIPSAPAANYTLVSIGPGPTYTPLPLTAALVNAVPSAYIGSANGVASLDSSAHIPVGQLPTSGIPYASLASTPTIPTAVNSLTRLASDYSSFYLGLSGGSITGGLSVAGTFTLPSFTTPGCLQNSSTGQVFSGTCGGAGGGATLTPSAIQFGITGSTTRAATIGDINTLLATGSTQMAQAITKLPRVDARHTDFAGGADPTNTNDAAPAIMAAYTYAVSQRITGSTIPPVLYLGPGVFKLASTLEFSSSGPCPMIMGDFRQTTVLNVSGANNSGVVFNGCTVGGSGPAYAEGGLMNLTIRGQGHTSTGDGIDAYNSINLFFRNILISNMGGTGFVAYGAAERLSGDGVEFANNRIGATAIGNANEEFFSKTLFSSNGVDIGGYSYNINAQLPSCIGANTCGVFPSSGALLPDPHAALVYDGTQNDSFEGSSFKSTQHIGGAKFIGSDLAKNANYYVEGFVNGAITHSVQIFGATELGHLTAALSSSATSMSVDDAAYQPIHFGTCTDAAALASSGTFQPATYINTYHLRPSDYLAGSTATSRDGSGVLRGNDEIVIVAAFCNTTASASNALGGQGTGYILTTGGRGQGGTAAQNWPVGTVVYQQVAPSANVSLAGLHVNGTYQLNYPYTQTALSDTVLQAPGTWLYTPSTMAGEVIASAVVDGIAVTAPNQAGAAVLNLDKNEFFFNVPTAVGSISLASGGSGYAVGNTLSIPNTNGATAVVQAVSSGVITAISLGSMGTGNATLGTNVAVTGGSGSGATVNVLTTAELLGAGMIKVPSNADILDNNVGALSRGGPQPVYSNALSQVYQAWANVVAIPSGGVTPNMHYTNVPLGIYVSPQESAYVRQSVGEVTSGYSGFDFANGMYLNDLGPNGCPLHQFVANGYPAAFPSIQYNVNNGTTCGLNYGWQLLAQAGGTVNEIVTGNSSVGGNQAVSGSQAVAGTSTVAGLTIPSGGIQHTVASYATGSATAIPITQEYTLTTGGSWVLPASTSATKGLILNVVLTGAAVTITAPTGTTIFYNGENYGQSFATGPWSGTISFLSDGSNQWITTSNRDEIGQVSATTGAGLGGTATQSLSADAMVKSGTLTLTSTSAGTAGSTLATVTFGHAILGNCHPEFSAGNTAAATLMLAISAAPSNSAIVIATASSQVPAGTYVINYECNK